MNRQFLRAQRRTAGLSQQEVADRLGVHVNSISNWEQGVTRCPYPGRVLDAIYGHPIYVRDDPTLCLTRGCDREPTDDGWCEPHRWLRRWPLDPPAIPESPRRGWESDAACRGMDTEVFYCERGDAPDWRAVKACAGCPVAGDCVAADIASARGREDVQGIRGGMSPRARQRVYSERLSEWRRRSA